MDGLNSDDAPIKSKPSAKSRVRAVLDGEEVGLYSKEKALALLQGIAEDYAEKRGLISKACLELMGKWSGWETPKEIKVSLSEKTGLPEDVIDAIIASETPKR